MTRESPEPADQQKKQHEKGQVARNRWVVASLIALAIVVGTLGNELRVQDWDPQYTRVLVERTQAFGGTYYENGIHNKGPLEPALHSLGTLFTSSDGYWYAIAALATLLALFLGFAASRTTAIAGVRGPMAMGVGAAVFIHFTFSSAAYGGVVYVRNLTIVMLAAIWIIAITDAAWSTPRRRRLSAIGVAVLAGTAAQSLLTSVPTIAVLVVMTLLLLRDRAPDWERIRLTGIAFLAFDIAFLSAPAWYWLRGAFEEYWAGWYVYSQYTAAGTERSLMSQLVHGWQSFFEYHQTRPLIVFLVIAFGVMVWLSWKGWDRKKRTIHVFVVGWWVAAWIELTLSQRFSTHYFAISAIPLVLMAALLVGRLGRRFLALRPALSRSPALLLAVIVVTVYVSGPVHVTNAIRRTVDFRGPGVEAAQREANFDGTTRTARAILDLVSEEGDPLLVWTNAPWPYLVLERVSATRFIWKSHLIGEIYLGATSPEYILPDTEEWFREDLEESAPIAAAEADATLQPGNPLADAIESSFTRVYAMNLITLYLRNDIVPAVLDPLTADPWVGREPPGDPTGWEHTIGSASYTSGVADRTYDTLPIAGSCMSLTGTVSWSEGEEAGIAFLFRDTAGVNEPLHMAIERHRAFSSSDFVLYEEHPLDLQGPADFGLVVGTRSAVLTVNDEVVAALRLPPDVEVHAQVRATELQLTNLSVGEPPDGSGCD